MNGRAAILHHGDWDGMVSAWCVVGYYPMDAEQWDLHPVQYGSPVPKGVVGYDRVFVLDFSYSADVLVELAQRNDALTVIDHHKTAVENLASWVPPENTTVILESERNGVAVAACELCWDHVWAVKKCKPPKAPLLVQYAADRDTWAFRLPWSKEVSAHMQSVPMELHLCAELHAMFSHEILGVGYVASLGNAIIRYQRTCIDQAVKAAEKLCLPILVGGELRGEALGLAANMPVSSLISDTAGELARKEIDGRQVDFGCCYFRVDDEWVYSLRSSGTIDVSMVAKGLGGGGHKTAAGFKSVIAPWQTERGWPDEPKAEKHPEAV